MRLMVGAGLLHIVVGTLLLDVITQDQTYLCGHLAPSAINADYEQ